MVPVAVTDGPPSTLAVREDDEACPSAATALLSSDSSFLPESWPPICEQEGPEHPPMGPSSSSLDSIPCEHCGMYFASESFSEHVSVCEPKSCEYCGLCLPSGLI